MTTMPSGQPAGSLVRVTPEHLAEAADALALAMRDDAWAAHLMPDLDERLAVVRALYADLIARALEEGRVDAWGDPIVGVAIWLRRPPVADAPAASGTSAHPGRSPVPLPPDAVERAEAFAAVMRHLREVARPDEHAYLDSIGVLPDHRRRGIATRLLLAGHAWADAAGLPCALDTLTDENVKFYARRGYAVVASAAVPGSDLRITAMRREREVPPPVGRAGASVTRSAPSPAPRSRGTR